MDRGKVKTGDKFPVYIAGQQVAEASVVEIENDAVTLIVPATRVVMAVRQELAPAVEPEQVDGTGNQHVMLGREDSAPGGESAPVGGVEQIQSNNGNVTADTSGNVTVEALDPATAPVVDPEAPVQPVANGEGDNVPIQTPAAVETNVGSSAVETPQPNAGQESLGDPA